MPIDGSTAAQWVPTGSVTVRTPGKINLYLAVGDLLESGYHELTTVFHAVSLVDEVTVRNADVLSLEITGEGADQLPLDERNLAWQAAELMAEHVGRAPDVSIPIDKSIPVAGGMGGGSADAAAVLVALNSLWELGVPRRDLHALAAQLGSDVPFALHGGTALGTGRGEELATVLARNTFHWVLAFAERRVVHAARCSASWTGCAKSAHRRASMNPTRCWPPWPPVTRSSWRRCWATNCRPAALSLNSALRRVLRAGVEAGALAGIVSGIRADVRVSVPVSVLGGRRRHRAVGGRCVPHGTGRQRPRTRRPGGAHAAVDRRVDFAAQFGSSLRGV